MSKTNPMQQTRDGREKLHRLTDRIGQIIDEEIRPIFIDGDRAKVTVMIRFEDGDEYDVLITNDTDEGIQEIVARRTQKEIKR